MRPFLHVSGKIQAIALSKEAFRALGFALGVAGTWKYFIDGGERKNISVFYKAHPSIEQ